MPKQIELDAMFTPYSIDTYQLFTMEKEEEYIIESLSEEIGRELTYDDINWTYDHKGYVQALANKRLELLQKNIIDNVILSIKSDGPATSPKEYNFKTDNSFEIYTINTENLNKYIEENKKNYEENKLKSCDGFMWLGNEDQTKLNYYLKTKTVKNYDNIQSYYYDMIESVNESEFIETKIIN